LMGLREAFISTASADFGAKLGFRGILGLKTVGTMPVFGA